MVESTSTWFGGDGLPISITEGTVEGSRVRFKAGINTLEGKIDGDRMVLERSVSLPWTAPSPSATIPNGPAIGPAPDGSDPSMTFDMGALPKSVPLVLKRASR
jgi:beta-galactosidase